MPVDLSNFLSVDFDSSVLQFEAAIQYNVTRQCEKHAAVRAAQTDWVGSHWIGPHHDHRSITCDELPFNGPQNIPVPIHHKLFEKRSRVLEFHIEMRFRRQTNCV